MNCIYQGETDWRQLLPPSVKRRECSWRELLQYPTRMPGQRIYSVTRCERYKLVQRGLKCGPDMYDRVIDDRCDDDALRFRCEAIRATHFVERTVFIPHPITCTERSDIALIGAKRHCPMRTVICEKERDNAVLHQAPE